MAPNNHAYGEESWDLITDWLEAGVNICTAWNMVLDTEGVNLDETRSWPQNALLAVDMQAKTLQVTPTYYVFRHIIRTTFMLQFMDGSKQFLEVAPKGVYGITLEARRGGKKARSRSMFVAAESDLAYDDQKGHKRYFVTNKASVAADVLSVKVQLGRTERPLVKARAMRFGYDSDSSRWVRIGRPAKADAIRRVSTKLNGGTEREAIWKGSWRDGDALVSGKKQGRYSETKTVIELSFAPSKSGNTPAVTRTIEVSSL
jgi:hypothetical protein